MKMRMMYLTLLIVLLLKISQAVRLREELANKEEAKNEAAPAAKADKININVNGLGHVTKQTVVLDKFPMVVKSCEQMAIFAAKYITDMNDYKQRADGWFSISAYTVSHFKDKDANQLIHSVDIGNLRSLPDHLDGASGCISVDGGSIADITICLPDKASADNLLSVIKTYYNCRRGDNLQVVPPELVKKLVKQCAENKDKPKEEIKPNNKWDADRVRYFHPAGIAVPGTQ